MVRAFGARVDADQFRLQLNPPAPVIALGKAGNGGPRHDGVLMDPIERSANAFLPFGRAVFGGEVGAAPPGIPAFNVGIALRAERDFGEVERQRTKIAPIR